MAEHTSKQFDAELESVRSRVLHMGGLVEEQITRAMEALISGDMDLMERVISDDHRVNALEVDLDESCSHIIADAAAPFCLGGCGDQGRELRRLP